MSIYFQYPSIDEYPNLVYPLKSASPEAQIQTIEDYMIQQHIQELKDFLALKPV